MLNNNNLLLDDVTPLTFQLGQNYPNPFKDRTIIKYCIAYKTKVKLKVYDEEHKEIETLVDEEKNPGTYEAFFQSAIGSLSDGKTGRQLASGIYFYKLQAGDFTAVKKMLLIK